MFQAHRISVESFIGSAKGSLAHTEVYHQIRIFFFFLARERFFIYEVTLRTIKFGPIIFFAKYNMKG